MFKKIGLLELAAARYDNLKQRHVRRQRDAPMQATKKRIADKSRSIGAMAKALRPDAASPIVRMREMVDGQPIFRLNLVKSIGWCVPQWGRSMLGMFQISADP